MVTRPPFHEFLGVVVLLQPSEPSLGIARRQALRTLVEAARLDMLSALDRVRADLRTHGHAYSL